MHIKAGLQLHPQDSGIAILSGSGPCGLAMPLPCYDLYGPEDAL